MSKEEYTEIRAISASLLKNFASMGVEIFSASEKRESVAMNYGDALDIFVLSGEEAYKDKFIVHEMRYEKDNNLGILYNYIKNTFYPTFNRLPDEDELIAAIYDLKLWANIKNVKLLQDRVNSAEFTAELKMIPQLYNRFEITSEEDLMIRTHKAAIESTPNANELIFSEGYNHIKFYLEDVPFVDHDNSLLNISLKCEIDRLIFDHENHVIKIIDLKSGDPKLKDFKRNFFDLYYWIQLTLYRYILQRVISGTEFESYSIELYIVYCSKQDPNHVAVYDLSDWYHTGITGWVTPFGTRVKGVFELISDYVFHINNNLTKYPIEVYKHPKNYFTIQLPINLDN